MVDFFTDYNFCRFSFVFALQNDFIILECAGEVSITVYVCAFLQKMYTLVFVYFFNWQKYPIIGQMPPTGSKSKRTKS